MATNYSVDAEMISEEEEEIDVLATSLDQCREFVIDQVGKVNQRLLALEAKNKTMTDSLSSLEAENTTLRKRISELKGEAEAAAANVVSNFCIRTACTLVNTGVVPSIRDGLLSQDDDSGVINLDSIPLNQLLNMTPGTQSVQDESQQLIATSIPQETSVEPPYITTLEQMEDCPEKVEIMPYYEASMKSPVAKDKLHTPLQRAFLKLKANEILVDGSKMNKCFIKELIEQGQRLKIWDRGFCPRGQPDLSSYVRTSLGNQVKRLKKRMIVKKGEEQLKNAKVC